MTTVRRTGRGLHGVGGMQLPSSIVTLPRNANRALGGSCGAGRRRKVDMSVLISSSRASGSNQISSISPRWFFT